MISEGDRISVDVSKISFFRNLHTDNIDLPELLLMVENTHNCLTVSEVDTQTVRLAEDTKSRYWRKFLFKY